MSEATQRTGGCHCGAVRYEVKTALEPLISCNCSICQKRGLILTFAPETDFRVISGDGAQTDYLFGKQSIHHLFCKTCGVASFAQASMPDGTPSVAINVRTIDGIDVADLHPQPFDGKSL